MGGIEATWRFRVAKNHSVPISNMAAMEASWKFFKLHVFPNRKSVELKLGGRHQSDMEI